MTNKNFKWTSKIDDNNFKLMGNPNVAVIRITNLYQDC